MANYPEILDNFTPKVDDTNDVMAADVNGLQTAVAALQTKVGVDSSAVESSHDYKLGTVTGSNKAETQANKETSALDTSTTKYPCNNVVKTAVDGKASLTGTETLTNKRITKRVATTTDDATAVIDCDSYDEYYLTAIANDTEISITGTPTAGQTIFIGLKDAGVTKALTWTGITGLGVTLPDATTAGKQHIIGIKYIAAAWRAIAVGLEA